MSNIIKQEKIGKLMVSTVALREFGEEYQLFVDLVDSLMGWIKPYETIIFVVRDDDSWELSGCYHVQYDTIEEAIKGHEYAVEFAKNNQDIKTSTIEEILGLE